MRTHLLPLLAGAVLLLSSGLVACDDSGDGDGAKPSGAGSGGELGTATAALTATENIETSLENADASLTFLEASLVAKRLFGLMPSLEGDEAEEGGGPSFEGPDGGDFAPDEDMDDAEEIEVALDEQGESVTQWLQDNVLVDSLIESESGATVVYKLDPAQLCDGGGEGPTAGPPGFEGDGSAKAPPNPEDSGDGTPFVPDEEFEKPEADPEAAGEDGCTKVLTEYPIRVALTVAGSNVDVLIMAGPDKLEILAIELHTDRLSVQLDLGAARTAIEAILELLDESDDAFLPETLTGVVRATLETTGPNSARASIAAVEPLELVVNTGDDRFAMSLGKSELSISADGAAKSATLTAAMGALTASFPLDVLTDRGESGCVAAPPMPGDEGSFDDPCGDTEVDEAPVEGTVDIAVAGFTAEAKLIGGSDSLTVTGVGFGTKAATFAVDGETLASYELNPADSHTFDVTVSANDAEQLIAAFSPLLHLELWLGLEPVADALEVPAWAFDETLTLKLSGGGTPTIEALDEGLRVISGTLELRSAAHPETDITVAAGQCLVDGSDDEPSEGSEAPSRDEDGSELPWSSLSSGSCPADG